jgi:hypothetical protein
MDETKANGGESSPLCAHTAGGDTVTSGVLSLAHCSRMLLRFGESSPEVDAALRHVVEGEFYHAIEDRFRFAHETHWEEVTGRCPVPLSRGDGSLDPGHLEDVAMTALAGLLSDPRFPGDRTAFGSLVAAMDRAGQGDWPDAACIGYLLGHRRWYRLPRQNQPDEGCPAIWRFVASAWHKDTEEDPSARRQNADLTINAVHRNLGNDPLPQGCVTGLHNDEPVYRRETVVGAAVDTTDSLVRQIRAWPDIDKRLLKSFFLSGPSIVKTSTIDRLIEQSELTPADCRKAVNTSVLVDQLGIPRAQVEKLVEGFLDRLLALRVWGTLSGDDIRHLLTVLSDVDLSPSGPASPAV